MQELTNVTNSYNENLEFLKQSFHNDVNTDIVIREFSTGAGQKCFVLYLDGMANMQHINDYIMRPLMLCTDGNKNIVNVLQTASIKSHTLFSDIISDVLAGDTAVYIENSACIILCETKGFDQRSVSTPETEVVIKGSQEAFSESVRTNITLIRKILRNKNLINEFIKVGDINQDLCSVLYIDGITETALVDEVKRRISQISADYISGSGMLEQLIDNATVSLLPSMLSTERPERAANYLSEGRVIIICDGTPFALVAPVTLSLMMESTEVNTVKWQSGSFIKIIRMFALFCCTLLPGIYISLTCYHREMIPTQLLGSIVEARANIPFPTPLAVLIMGLFFELIREAGQRIPRSLGNAIGIVGGLILGQSAVSANLVSPVTLIVVAIAGLSNAAIPDYDLAFSLRYIKLFTIIMASLMGLLGVAAASMIILAICVNEKSFGLPLLSFRSLRWVSGSSMFFQRPLWKQEMRTKELDPQKQRQQPDISRQWEKENAADS